MEQVTHLQAELGPSEEETNLLLAITLSEGRYETYIARKPMTFGRQLSPGSAVFVEVKGHSNVLPGIVRYKGVLPPIPGTWFGVELIVSILLHYLCTLSCVTGCYNLQMLCKLCTESNTTKDTCYTEESLLLHFISILSSSMSTSPKRPLD